MIRIKSKHFVLENVSDSCWLLSEHLTLHARDDPNEEKG